MRSRPATSERRGRVLGREQRRARLQAEAVPFRGDRIDLREARLP